MNYRLAFAVVLGLYLLAALTLPRTDLNGWELYIMPPSVGALVFLAWKAKLL